MTEFTSEIRAIELTESRAQLEFDDNLLLPLLYGERDQHLDRIERQLGVSVVTRGNRLAISGPVSAAETAHLALSQLYDRLKRGQEVNLSAVEAAIRFAAAELADKSRFVAGGCSVPHSQAAHRRRAHPGSKCTYGRYAKTISFFGSDLPVQARPTLQSLQQSIS